MTKSLQSYGTTAIQARAGYSKLDRVLEEMPDKDAAVLRSWLEDPQWTDNAIADSLSGWAADNDRRELKCSHGVIMRWRELNRAAA